MKLLSNISLYILIIIAFPLYAFDVRVLLDRVSIPDDATTNIKISSSHGVTVSGIDHKIHGMLTITCSKNDIKINGISVSDEWIQIAPVLVANHEKKIQQFVEEWIKDNQDSCNEKMISLQAWYKRLVLDKNLTDYVPLYAVIFDCVKSCIQDFIDPVEYPVISYDTLVQNASELLKNQLKDLIKDAIAEKKISKQLLKQLQSSEKIRTDFFIKIVQKILSTFLYQYFLQLPHKIIYQAIKEDVSCLLFNKHKYVGMFYIIRQGSDILLINSLDIDDYLLSVLFFEGWPGWPLEVKKALVVASRTYLVEKILQANKTKKPYHIVNTIKHQTYKGHHKFIKLKQAVDETRNIFIAYKGQPIEAMFDACCGGVIPAKIEGLNFNKHPYLARTKPCIYCKKSWIYNWKKEFSPLEILEIIQQDHPDVTMIKDIKVVDRDDAGLVKKVLVVTSDKKIYISGKKMYSLFSSVKSFCYTIKRRGKGYLFEGRGYGHHIGLCQWGALGMVEDGWNYKSILQFYYPDTEFMKLSLSR